MYYLTKLLNDKKMTKYLVNNSFAKASIFIKDYRSKRPIKFYFQAFKSIFVVKLKNNRAEDQMSDNEQIVNKIVEGIQERKGKRIAIVDLTKLKESPCNYFVICEGDSVVHVNAVAHSIKDWVNQEIKVKPYATDGFENCEWIAMDYGQIIVHVFQRSAREFYDIEHLWADGNIKFLEDVL